MTATKPPDDTTFAGETKSLLRVSVWATAGVLLSRASGVVRTLVVNSTFGAGVSLDAFYAAFRFPNSLRDLFADGALSAAFIKGLVDAQQKGGVQEERRLIASVLGFFSCVTILLAFCGVFFAHPLMALITNERFQASGGLELAALLFKIMAFYLPLTMLNAVAMAILGVHGDTFRAMNGSAFLSVGMIFGALVLGPLFHLLGGHAVIGLAAGSLLGVLLQTIYQFRPLFKLGLIPLPNLNIRKWFADKPLHEVIVLMLPRAFGQGALSIALLINTLFAIEVGQGVLTYIVTAVMIIQVPIGLFGVATGFAAHPVLTRAFKENERMKFSKLLTSSLETSLWLALLTTAGFCLLIVPFYGFVFQHGKISFHDTIQNSVAVCSYAIGIVFASGSKVLINAFYALNQTKQIVYNAIVYLLASATLTSLLAPHFGILGLGLSYSTATALDFALNMIFLKKNYSKGGHAESPYAAGGQGFLGKIMGFSLLSYVLGLTGVFLTLNFWQHFSRIFPVPLDFWTNGVIFFFGSALFATASILLVWFLGPAHLRDLLGRAIGLLSRHWRKKQNR